MQFNLHRTYQTSPVGPNREKEASKILKKRGLGVKVGGRIRLGSVFHNMDLGGFPGVGEGSKASGQRGGSLTALNRSRPPPKRGALLGHCAIKEAKS